MSSTYYVYYIAINIRTVSQVGYELEAYRNHSLETEKKQQALRKMWDGVSRKFCWSSSNGSRKSVSKIQTKYRLGSALSFLASFLL